MPKICIKNFPIRYLVFSRLLIDEFWRSGNRLTILGLVLARLVLAETTLCREPGRYSNIPMLDFTLKSSCGMYLQIPYFKSSFFFHFRLHNRIPIISASRVQIRARRDGQSVPEDDKRIDRVQCVSGRARLGSPGQVRGQLTGPAVEEGVQSHTSEYDKPITDFYAYYPW